MPKVKTPQRFVIETLPWKSKKVPSEVPEPLPIPGEDHRGLSFVLCARRFSGKTLTMVNLIRAYKKQMQLIIVLSPTVHLDKNWNAITKYDNVWVSETVDNELLQKIVDHQKKVYDKNKPKENRCLVVIDDMANYFRRKEMRLMLNVMFTSFRHLGGDLIVGTQNLTLLEGTQIENTLQWCLWDMSDRQLKKLAKDISTSRMRENQLERFVRENTKQPFSHVFIDYMKPPDQCFWVGFDHVWNPSD